MSIVWLACYNADMEEIELTFLPKELPAGVFGSKSKELLDIYLPAGAVHPKLRVRRSGTTHEITKKQAVQEGDASHQIETTIPLTPEEFVDLEKLEGKRVHKTRYYYAENGIDYEVDVFQDALQGLVLVDIEFTTLADKAAFVAPSWLLAEVTQEEFIAGGMLCGKRYEDIAERLQAFGYVRK